MTYEDFLKNLKDNQIYITNHIYKEYGDDLEGDFLKEEWVIGGQTGGSCWDDGDSRHYPRTPEDEPEFDDLDKIFEIYYPSITFMKYKKACQDLIKYVEYSQNDYYGNYSDIKIKYVDLKSLYEFLQKKP